MKESLTRKIGPLPAWVWAIALFVGVWIYRNKFSRMASTSTTGLLPPEKTPQSPVVLQPGESVYDPNTGALIHGDMTPGGSGAGNTTNNYNVSIPQTDGKRKQKPKKPKLTAKGAKYGPFGAKRPPKKKGFTIKGLGHGWWEYVPIPRSKSHTTGARKQHKHQTQGHSKQRSGGAPESGHGDARYSKDRGRTGRTEHHASQDVPNQRPVATHPAPSPAQAHVPPVRQANARQQHNAGRTRTTGAARHTTMASKPREPSRKSGRR